MDSQKLEELEELVKQGKRVKGEIKELKAVYSALKVDGADTLTESGKVEKIWWAHVQLFIDVEGDYEVEFDLPGSVMKSFLLKTLPGEIKKLEDKFERLGL